MGCQLLLMLEILHDLICHNPRNYGSMAHKFWVMQDLYINRKTPEKSAQISSLKISRAASISHLHAGRSKGP